MAEPDHLETIRDISDRIVATQAPIRLLDAVKWDDSIRERFFAAGCREQPPVDAAYYEARGLDYDTDALRTAFIELEAEIVSRLGTVAPVAELMRRRCASYRTTLDLVDARGTEAIGALSTLLYGSPDDVFHAGGPTVADLADSLGGAMAWVDEASTVGPEAETYDGPEAVVRLQELLDESMGPGLVTVKLDDGIVADAAAGADYVKLRADAKFSETTLRQYEAHEGWVHIGTTLNGLAQPWCTFLGKAPPDVVLVQEGVASITEVLALRSHPARLRRIVHRIHGIRWAAEGATFLDVFERLRVEGLDEDEAYQTAMRVFRGSTPTGPPFAKDLSYGKGMVLAYAFIRLAMRRHRPELVHLLFAGKVDLASMGAMALLADEGIVAMPRFVPPPFRDLDGLSAQIAFSRFLRDLDFDQLGTDFAGIL